MSEADDEVSDRLWELARDPKYAEIADTLAEAAGHIVSLNAIVDMELPRWSPIETAPKNGTEILAWGLLRGSYGYTADEWCRDIIQWNGGWLARRMANRYATGFSPTHWQPLPAPPEAPHE
jgi:hypothetical protein